MAEKIIYDGIKDEQFTEPYIDIDEWRDQPVCHRYVHGGFHGTETRFCFYYPPKEEFKGRFFQKLAPVQRSGSTIFAEGGHGNVCMQPTLWICFWRKRRRIQDHELCGEHDRDLGRHRAICYRLADGHAECIYSKSTCHASVKT